MKTMANVMENTVAVFFFLFIFVSIVDAKRRDRFDIIEKRIGSVETRISVVETRINSDNELAKSLQQNLEELNNSMINFKDQMCPTLHQQTGKEKQTSSAKRVELLKSSRILVSLGLNREKQWTRDQVEKLTGLVNEQTGLLNQNFSELKNELKDDKEEMESNLEVINAKIDDKIQTKMSKLDEIITNNVKDIKEVSAKIDDKFQTKLSKLDEIITNNVKEMNEVSLKSDTTEQLISVLQREIEALKETQAKLLNVLISANFINYDLKNLVNFDYTCLSNWTKYSSYCYLFVEERKRFSEARVHCKRLGATLSDIENKAENTFFRGLAGYWDVRIGYSDEKEEGTWISERTGQPASFTNFYTDQPNSIHKNCVHLAYGNDLWIDASCHIKTHFVCKKDAKMDIMF